MAFWYLNQNKQKKKKWHIPSKLTGFLTEWGKVCKNDSLMLSFGRSGSSWGQNDTSR